MVIYLIYYFTDGNVVPGDSENVPAEDVSAEDVRAEDVRAEDEDDSDVSDNSLEDLLADSDEEKKFEAGENKINRFKWGM